jgi:import receptor subunit TOM22
MVKLHEIPDSEAFDDASSIHSSSSSSYSSVSDLSDDDSETLYERLAALKDMIPADRRRAISTRLSRVYNTCKSITKTVGSLTWIVATSSLLIFVPLAVEMEKESQQRQWEKEMRLQQASMSTPTPPTTQGIVPPGF